MRPSRQFGPTNARPLCAATSDIELPVQSGHPHALPSGVIGFSLAQFWRCLSLVRGRPIATRWSCRHAFYDYPALRAQTLPVSWPHSMHGPSPTPWKLIHTCRGARVANIPTLSDLLDVSPPRGRRDDADWHCRSANVHALRRRADVTSANAGRGSSPPRRRDRGNLLSCRTLMAGLLRQDGAPPPFLFQSAVEAKTWVQ
jgi:hypothetical protein